MVKRCQMGYLHMPKTVGRRLAWYGTQRAVQTRRRCTVNLPSSNTAMPQCPAQSVKQSTKNAAPGTEQQHPELTWVHLRWQLRFESSSIHNSTQQALCQGCVGALACPGHGGAHERQQGLRAAADAVLAWHMQAGSVSSDLARLSRPLCLGKVSCFPVDNARYDVLLESTHRTAWRCRRCAFICHDTKNAEAAHRRMKQETRAPQLHCPLKICSFRKQCRLVAPT